MTDSDDDRRHDSFAYHLTRGTWPPARGAHLASVGIDANPGAGAATRRALEQHLRNRVRPDELELLKMVTCEVVANAVLHGDSDQLGRVELLIGAAPGSFRIEVRDEGGGFEYPLEVSSRFESGGFGLVIVDRIATRWGAATDQGSCVWFELDR
jgi:anti-sigma regulatory factor (Ser/Thr protein kinase)